MEKTVRKFSSFAEAEAAEREFWRSLTPEERMAIFSELQRRYQGDPPPDSKEFIALLNTGDLSLRHG